MRNAVTLMKRFIPSIRNASRFGAELLCQASLVAFFPNASGPTHSSTIWLLEVSVMNFFMIKGELLGDGVRGRWSMAYISAWWEDRSGNVGQTESHDNQPLKQLQIQYSWLEGFFSTFMNSCSYVHLEKGVFYARDLPPNAPKRVFKSCAHFSLQKTWLFNYAVISLLWIRWNFSLFFCRRWLQSLKELKWEEITTGNAPSH